MLRNMEGSKCIQYKNIYCPSTNYVIHKEICLTQLLVNKHIGQDTILEHTFVGSIFKVFFGIYM